MAISVFDLFKVGIGPSSSHTVGPMLAAARFIDQLSEAGNLSGVARIKVELYGSLGATGKGHGTDKALMLGLMGETPESVDVTSIPERIASIRQCREIAISPDLVLSFDPEHDLLFHRERQLNFHANGMRFTAWDDSERQLLKSRFYSVGGGFVVQENEQGEPVVIEDQTSLCYPFN
ncbi:MAG: L-serine ammonia-lyase, partial [Candidatus Thiodiazotropha sp. (ex Notomyrtea botanica)]|nr:L-serine ammonia-lyase [Candidatus Thiodiazotropha sp. (ex Notomyrtea botanica)]